MWNLNMLYFYSTTSEGNHMEIHRRRGGASTVGGGSSSKSSSGMFSGSPMSPSPGSYVSSESAGSSNSLDEAEFGPERRHSEEKNIYFFYQPINNINVD